MSTEPSSQTTTQTAPPASHEETEPLETGRSLVRIEESGERDKDGWLFSWLFGLFGKRRNGTTSREDLADALQDQEGLGQGFSAEERSMLASILQLQDKRVEDLMVPRADITAVSQDILLADLLRVFEDSGHSRMPVFGDTLDDPRGMVHIRDVLAHIVKSSNLSKLESERRKRPLPGNLDLRKVKLGRPIAQLKLIRDMMYVPPSMGARELMARMQAERVQIALIIDEYGGTDGLITLEDIVEQIVGNIEDEHDDEDTLIADRADGIWLCDAKVELDILREKIGEDFQFGEHEEDVDTLGGLIFDIIGRVPVRGEIIANNGFEFRIIAADPRRIRRIEIIRSARRRTRRADNTPHNES